VPAPAASDDDDDGGDDEDDDDRWEARTTSRGRGRGRGRGATLAAGGGTALGVGGVGVWRVHGKHAPEEEAYRVNQSGGARGSVGQSSIGKFRSDGSGGGGGGGHGGDCGRWSCRTCTYLNNLTASTCAICTTPHITTRSPREQIASNSSERGAAHRGTTNQPAQRPEVSLSQSLRELGIDAEILSDGLVEGYIADSVAMLEPGSSAGPTDAECGETAELLTELLRGYGADMIRARKLVQELAGRKWRSS
jgi:hypothetical protein